MNFWAFSQPQTHASACSTWYVLQVCTLTDIFFDLKLVFNFREPVQDKFRCDGFHIGEEFLENETKVLLEFREALFLSKSVDTLSTLTWLSKLLAVSLRTMKYGHIPFHGAMF